MERRGAVSGAVDVQARTETLPYTLGSRTARILSECACACLGRDGQLRVVWRLIDGTRVPVGLNSLQ